VDIKRFEAGETGSKGEGESSGGGRPRKKIKYKNAKIKNVEPLRRTYF
jgi:hypothetical protein